LKTIKPVLLFFILIAYIYVLNISVFNLPPIGKLLNPYSGFFQNGLVNKFDEIELPGIKDEVNLQIDSLLIPHIYAKNDEDLYYVQGYMHAFHRLWQMEFQIMSTSGRLSEIFGERALSIDRASRRKGLLYAAKNTLEVSKKDLETLKYIQAYTNGINDYILSCDIQNLPIEYKLLNYKPEKWTILKSFLLMEQMSDMLSRRNQDIEDTYLLEILGKEEYDFLFPEIHQEVDPIIPRNTNFEFTPKKLTRKRDTIYPKILINETLKKPDPYNGSNNFAISGKRTKNGNPILGSQPDLSLNLPSIWYAVHLNSPTVNTMGVSLPGAPGVIIGFNDSIAWGETNATRDVVDFYKIKFKDNKRKEYLFDGKWLKTEKIIEKFKVKNSNPFYDTIIFTHHGPITYDRNFLGNNDKVNLAMRWIAHDASIEYKTFFKLNRAKNISDIKEALSYFDGPAQNFAYATTEGDIGMTIAGKFPIKWKEQGKFLLDGSNRDHEWSGYIPFEHALTMINPKRNYVSSANQHPSDKSYPYYTYSHNYEYYRGRRLNERLETILNATIEDAKSIQNDNFNYTAYEILPVLLEKIDTINFDDNKKSYFDKLKKWDYFSNTKSIEASIFETWHYFLRKKIWDEFDTIKFDYRRPSNYNTFYLMKNFPELKYYDIVSTEKTENLSDIINLSFELMKDSIDNWKKSNSNDIAWKNYKNTTIRHLLRINDFSVSNINIGGNRNILNAASKYHGPSWRMIVELDPKGTKAWGIYPGGQSGNPGNINYSLMIKDWAVGKYHKLLFNNISEKIEDQMLYTKKFKK
tara:strand:- start:6497 stop:8908 length:2412 start_codon:yes stop_codon:yes gene_type:complete